MATIDAIPDDALEDTARTVQAPINYLQPGPDINRRFVSAGVEVNTGSYAPHEVTVRDGRSIRHHFTPDVHGFALIDHRTAVTDFYDRAAVDSVYPAEVEQAVQAATGADFVTAMGWMIRNSGEIRHLQTRDGPYSHHGGIQPPGGEVHIDTEPGRADRIARRVYAKARPDGPGFRRFIFSSFWRTFSAPPQDWPLAVCDSRTVSPDEGVPNVMYIVDTIPEGDAMFAPMDDDAQMAAAVFRHNPRHRWWYFSGMTRDEALLFKFHDSDHDVAWRTPHTAFHDPSFAHANVRESIECRSIAFWE